MQKRVLLETYGCTLNQADSDIMEGLLGSAGYEVVHDPSLSYDYAVINTCTVKRATEQKILHRINEVKGIGSRLIVAGCMAGSDPALILKNAPESRILNTSNVDRIVDAIEGSDYPKGHSRIDKAALVPNQGRVITRIPISDGCLSNCTFCETKHARGALNSFPDKTLLKAIEMNVTRGAMEIELTSQDTGAYGLDRKTDIAELVSAAASIEGEFKIRVGMLNPEHLHRYFDRLIEACRERKVYKFLHLPVQSGSNKVLKDMERRYTREEFLNYCNEARKKIPGMNIATDIIVGYPTETEQDFQETMNLLSEARPETINISRFSTRPHARARKLKQLRSQEVKRRSIEISREARRIQKGIREVQIGSVKRVLVTELGKTPMGRDDSYQQISIVEGRADIGQVVDVRITGATQACMLGKVS